MDTQPVNLDADTQRVLARLTANPFLDPSMSIPQMRAAFEAFYAAMYAGFKPIVEGKYRRVGSGAKVSEKDQPELDRMTSRS